jgi:hypothetical protein
MLPSNHTYDQQKQLGVYCRTGKNKPVSEKPDNIEHYRRLVYNVVDDILVSAFPLAKNLLKDKNWDKAVSNFLEKHNCQTSQVWKLSAEFYEFYLNQPFPFKNKYPFLLDLLLFEYKEIEIYMMEDIPAEDFKLTGDLQKDFLVANPEIQILSLEYPVHTKKAKDIKAKDKSHYFVSLHRNYITKDVHFNDLSYPFVEIIAKINETDSRFEDAVNIYSKYENDEVLCNDTILSFIKFALDNNIILGYK